MTQLVKTWQLFGIWRSMYLIARRASRRVLNPNRNGQAATTPTCRRSCQAWGFRNIALRDKAGENFLLSAISPNVSMNFKASIK